MTPLPEHYLRCFLRPKLIVAYLIVAIVLGIDLVWLARSDFRVIGDSLYLPAFLAAAAILMLRFVKSEALRTMISDYTLLIVAWPALRLFNHLTFTASGDFVDHMFADWDAALNLNWVGYASWLDGHPRLTLLIGQTYGSLTPLSIAAFILVAFMCSRETAEEYLLLFVISAVAVSVVGIFLPALGPMVYFADITSKFQYISQVGQSHVPVYEGYRNGTLKTMALDRLMGLTTFPSFHTAMGCIITYVCRSRLLLFVPATVYSVTMIAGAVIYGSHYFVDIFAGIGVTFIAIVLMRLLSRGTASRELDETSAKPEWTIGGTRAMTDTPGSPIR